jgi:hypothetical protein
MRLGEFALEENKELLDFGTVIANNPRSRAIVGIRIRNAVQTKQRATPSGDTFQS